jgi:hypothetical protein
MVAPAHVDHRKVLFHKEIEFQSLTFDDGVHQVRFVHARRLDAGQVPIGSAQIFGCDQGRGFVLGSTSMACVQVPSQIN